MIGTKEQVSLVKGNYDELIIDQSALTKRRRKKMRCRNEVRAFSFQRLFFLFFLEQAYPPFIRQNEVWAST
jgi:hypothetical protein